MATGGTNGAVELWDADGYGSFKAQAHQGRVHAIALSPRGVHLATGGEDGTIKLWRARELMDEANSKASQKRSR
jgi:WD40 repeat protein